MNLAYPPNPGEKKVKREAGDVLCTSTAPLFENLTPWAKMKCPVNKNALHFNHPMHEELNKI